MFPELVPGPYSVLELPGDNDIIGDTRRRDEIRNARERVAVHPVLEVDVAVEGFMVVGSDAHRYKVTKVIRFHVNNGDAPYVRGGKVKIKIVQSFINEHDGTLYAAKTAVAVEVYLDIAKQVALVGVEDDGVFHGLVVLQRGGIEKFTHVLSSFVVYYITPPTIHPSAPQASF